MMGAVRGWLLAVIAVSLLCAVADALMPPGAVRRVGRLVCGLTLLLAILTPLSGLDIAEGQRWLEDCLTQVDLREAELKQEIGDQMKIIIEQDCAAYIVDKAAQFGFSCSAQVECQASEEGVYIPVRAVVTGPPMGEAGVRLSRIVAEDLGIPESEQIYIDEEEVP